MLTLAEEEHVRRYGYLNDTAPSPTPTSTRVTSADGSVELILNQSGDDAKDYDNKELGRLFRFRNTKTGDESLVGEWPGFQTIWGPLHLRGGDNSYFLIQPPLQTIFLYASEQYRWKHCSCPRFKSKTGHFLRAKRGNTDSNSRRAKFLC
jgi:hypothetical protein